MIAVCLYCGGGQAAPALRLVDAGWLVMPIEVGQKRGEVDLLGVCPDCGPDEFYDVDQIVDAHLALAHSHNRGTRRRKKS